MRTFSLALTVPVVLASAFTAPTLDHIKAELPEGWTRQKMLEGTVLVLLAPREEAGWQANVFFELRRDQDGRSLEKMADDLLANLKKRKRGFELKTRQTITHRNGRSACVIEYAHNQQGLALREREMVMPLADGLVLFATASGAEAVWGKQEPVFERIFGSITVGDAKGAKVTRESARRLAARSVVVYA